MHKSKYLGMTWQFIALAAAACIGLVGIAYYHSGLHNPELVFVEMVKTLFPPFAAGFVLCGVLAASVSTMDSQILVSASFISEDLYKPFIRNSASPAELLTVTRLAVFLSLHYLYFSP